MPSSGLEYHPLQGTAVCPSRPNGGEKANIFKQKTPNFLDALLCPQADSNTIPFRGPLFEPRVPVGGERAHIFKQKRPRNWALFCAPKGPRFNYVLVFERVTASLFHSGSSFSSSVNNKGTLLVADDQIRSTFISPYS